MPSPRKAPDAWSVRLEDLPTEAAMAAEPRLRSLADNAVFRLIVFRERAIPRRGKRSEHPPQSLGRVPRLQLLDLIQAGYPAEDFAIGLWGASILHRFAALVSAAIVLAAGLALLFLVSGDRFGEAKFIALPMTATGAFILGARRAFPYAALARLGATTAMQRRTIERRLNPAIAARLFAKELAIVVVFFCLMGAAIVGAGFFLIAFPLGLYSALPFDLSQAPLLRILGVALALTSWGAGEARARHLLKNAKTYEGRLLENIRAIMAMLADEESQARVFPAKR